MMALFIEEMLDGGLEVGACERPEGGGVDGRPGGGGSTEARLEDGEVPPVSATRPPDRMESGPVVRLDGGAEGGGTEGTLDPGAAESRLEGGAESGETSRGPRVLSSSLISGSPQWH
jgi:hypothetical protein